MVWVMPTHWQMAVKPYGAKVPVGQGVYIVAPGFAWGPSLA